MNNAFLRKYVEKKADTGDYLHSSSYARAQSGDNMGAVSGAPRERLCAEERQFIKGYGDSLISGTARTSGPAAKPFTPPPATVSRTPRPQPPRPPIPRP